MIITNAVQLIPFSHLTRKQVAELLHKSPSAVDRYCTQGRMVNGQIIILHKQPNGTFDIQDVIDFINHINKKTDAN